MTAASAVGDEDAPEHLFLRFYIVLTSNYEVQPGLAELERDGEGNREMKAMKNLDNFIVER